MGKADIEKQSEKQIILTNCSKESERKLKNAIRKKNQGNLLRWERQTMASVKK